MRGLEIGGKFVKFTAIGIYLEESSLGALAEKWTTKSADELAASPDFYADIINGLIAFAFSFSFSFFVFTGRKHPTPFLPCGI